MTALDPVHGAALVTSSFNVVVVLLLVFVKMIVVIANVLWSNRRIFGM